MPIKPENRHRYPEDWPQIRERILARAGNACEKCKVPNRTRIARGAGADKDTYMLDTAEIFCAETGHSLGLRHMSDYQVGSMIDVVLTIAHLDHVPEHCDDENLRAWCQRCHLRYDAEHHRRTAWLTRRAANRTTELFEIEYARTATVSTRSRTQT